MATERERTNRTMNVAFTRHHPDCKLCCYSGYSKFCDFNRIGTCPYQSFMDDMKRNNKSE